MFYGKVKHSLFLNLGRGRDSFLYILQIFVDTYLKENNYTLADDTLDQIYVYI